MGGFVVAWTSGVSEASDQDATSIQVRSIDAWGRPLAEDLQVNAYTPGSQSLPAIAVSPTGSVLVAWQGDGSAQDDRSRTSVHARLLRPVVRIFEDGFESADPCAWWPVAPAPAPACD